MLWVFYQASPSGHLDTQRSLWFIIFHSHREKILQKSCVYDKLMENELLLPRQQNNRFPDDGTRYLKTLLHDDNFPLLISLMKRIKFNEFKWLGNSSKSLQTQKLLKPLSPDQNTNSLIKWKRSCAKSLNV